MLKLENIVKNYSDKKVIDHVSLKLKNGVYGLLGPNGAGKTTLLNIICGVVKPSSGNLYFNDKNILSNRGLLLDQIGYLPQNFNYYPSFTALEFLIYMGLLKGIKYNLEEKCWELLELVGLTVEANNKIKTFSGGMKQRLGIAQSLLNDPHLLVLDEPTVGLDPNERIKFRHLISSFYSWSDLFKTITTIFIPIALVSIIVIAGIFSEEKNQRIDGLILTTKYGRSKLTINKIAVSYSLSFMIFISVFSSVLLVFWYLYGFSGWEVIFKPIFI